jgi:hypothetical protein
VFAVTKAADDANRRTVCVDDDDRVEAIGFTCTAQVFQGLAGSVFT